MLDLWTKFKEHLENGKVDQSELHARLGEVSLVKTNFERPSKVKQTVLSVAEE